MTIASGDLIRFRTTGRFATVVTDIYTHRWIDSEDEEMMASGMGDLAGIYCGTFSVVMMDDGRKRRIKCHPETWDIIGKKLGQWENE